MIRKEEIEQAANGYLDSLFGGGKHQDLYVRLFMAGAQWKDEQFQKALDYAENCYGVFSFEQREKFIDTIKKIYEGE